MHAGITEEVALTFKKKEKPVRITTPQVDTEKVVETGLQFLENEMNKCLARSLTAGAGKLSTADINAVTRMLKTLMEVKAERRVSAISPQEASKLSDEQLAAEINKLLAKRAQ